ncbi:MAG: sigma-E processing peptidase SpoIIGA [Clostridiales bacterium]|nr:sigma-E processing peptidase SpoIIGA [Clostridiales bacterium]
MQAEIYADIVFIINFVMDAFIFWITSKLIKQKVKKWRIFTGSFFTAALFCLIIFIPQLRRFYNFFTCLLTLMGGILITFAPKKLSVFFKLIAFAHISAFCVGGLGIALFYYTNFTSVIGNYLSFAIGNFSVNILIAATCISYVVIKLAAGWIKRVLIKKQTFYIIKIYTQGQDLTINTLMDTGNSLKEPIGKLPVIITEFEAVKEILPDGLKLLYYEKKDENFEYILEILENADFKLRLRVIPYVSIGRQKGMLIGFKPDMVEVFKEDKKIPVKDVIIGIYNFKLSGDGSYQGLLNPEILT